MKNIIKITILLLVMLAGCSEEFLDIEPKDRANEAAFYKTADHAEQAVTAAYDPMKHPTLFNVNFFYMFTSWSDHSRHENRGFEQFNFDASNSYVTFTYAWLAKGVYRANNAIEKIPPIEMDEDLKTRLLGEAHFLRAFYNFYLTFIYYEPPLVTEVLTDIAVNLTNSTREAFMQQIASDLEYAIDVLPEQYDSKNVGRATKGAALALLGKAYLYNQQWDLAKEHLQQVAALEEQGVYSLMMPQGNDSLDYIFAYLSNFSEVDLVSPNATYDSENNAESIFEVQFEEGGWEAWEGGWQADGSLTSTYYGPFQFKNLVPTAAFVDQYEEPETHPAGLEYDPRRYATIYEEGDIILMKNGDEIAWQWFLHTNTAITDEYGYQKYYYPAHPSGPDGYNNDPNNLRIIRYADVLLMLAEADFHLNGETSTTLALESINKVRSRAGLEPVTEVTREVIMHERAIEMHFEWSRFFDVVRWSLLPNPWTNPEELMPGFEKGQNEYLPIPQREIDLSDGELKQPWWNN